MKRLASAGLALVLVATAAVAAVRHKEDVAAAEATAVLELVYVKHDYARAHGLKVSALRMRVERSVPFGGVSSAVTRNRPLFSASANVISRAS